MYNRDHFVNKPIYLFPPPNLHPDFLVSSVPFIKLKKWRKCSILKLHHLFKKKHWKIPKDCPEYISSVVGVSSCNNLWFLSEFKFFDELSLRVLSQFWIWSFIANFCFVFLLYVCFDFCFYLSCHDLSFSYW